MDNQLIATITISKHRSGQHYVRVQDSKGKWHEQSVDRFTSIGWNELRLLVTVLARDMSGENQLPF